MNEVLRELAARRSVRVFTDRPIGAAEREAILRAAAEAPTAGNQQLYTVLDVTDGDLKRELALACDDQPFIARGGLVLIFCADCQKWYDAYLSVGEQARLPGVGDLLLAVSDANIAAQNAVTAAWSLGIGSCYIGDIMENCERVRGLLCLPPYVFPAAMLVFGYPTEGQLARQKPERVAMEHIVHQNTYRRADAAQLRHMLEPRAGEKGYEQWLSAFCRRKYNSDFAREMTRSVACYLRDFRNE